MHKRTDTPLQTLVDTAKQDSDVLAVMLFGSVARGEQSRTSDVDVCLVVTPALSRDRAASSRKRREYLGGFDLDIQIFQLLPLHVRRRILKEGRVLFVRDEAALYGLAFRTAQAFEDFRHIYEAYLRQVASD